MREREQESSIIYLDGTVVRRLRGRIVSEDEHFITIERDDGTTRIALSAVQRIERDTRRGDDHGR